MVLSSYMLSPNYCGYLEKRGHHRVDLIGQVTKLGKNVMLLIVLVETLKRRELYGSAQNFKLHGYKIATRGQSHIEMSLRMGRRVATSSIKQCSKLSEYLHHTFVKGSLRDMNTSHGKYFR
eukprot:10644837-Ditylum_brightwellii.AAC.1